METEKLTALVLAAQKGDDAAATALYDAYQKDLYYHIYKTVNDTHLAEDLLQDTFIEILQTIQNLKEPAAFPSWSKQIAYHKCTAYFKKRREILADDSEDGYSVFDTVEEENAEFIPDEALDKAEFKQTIHAMIDSLPEEQRSALLLRYFDEISVKEIADIQGVSEGTVKSRLNYGRKAIKEAVEGYEKKHGIKLRCVGVVPLLLWLGREFALSKGISLTATTASTAYTATKAAAPVVAKGVKAGVKAVGKFTAKKLIAGIAIATAVSSGAAVTAVAAIGAIVAGIVLLLPKAEPAPVPVPEPDPMLWVGYGGIASSTGLRLEMTVEEMTDTEISGRFEIFYLYENQYSSAFSGTGIVKDDDVVYAITYEEPIVVNTIIGSYEYNEVDLVYSKSEDIFSFDRLSFSVYGEGMKRQTKEKPANIMENESWSGTGRDLAYLLLPTSHRQFDLDVDQMSEEDIRGKLTVYKDGELDHETEFTGRGYEKSGRINYEIMLEKPYTITTATCGEEVLDRFWLWYDIEEQKFLLYVVGITYSVEMEKIS